MLIHMTQHKKQEWLDFKDYFGRFGHRFREEAGDENAPAKLTFSLIDFRVTERSPWSRMEPSHNYRGFRPFPCGRAARTANSSRESLALQLMQLDLVLQRGCRIARSWSAAGPGTTRNESGRTLVAGVAAVVALPPRCFSEVFCFPFWSQTGSVNNREVSLGGSDRNRSKFDPFQLVCRWMPPELFSRGKHSGLHLRHGK